MTIVTYYFGMRFVADDNSTNTNWRQYAMRYIHVMNFPYKTGTI